MRLKIIMPSRVCLDIPVRRVVAEAPDGSFGMLPRHIDYVSQLAPGIVVFEDQDGQERYAAINSGTLVKCGDDVLVSTRNAILGDDLEGLQQRVGLEFRAIGETERTARSALARLEAEIVRRFQNLEHPA